MIDFEIKPKSDHLLTAPLSEKATNLICMEENDESTSQALELKRDLSTL